MFEVLHQPTLHALGQKMAHTYVYLTFYSSVIWILLTRPTRYSGTTSIASPRLSIPRSLSCLGAGWV